MPSGFAEALSGRLAPLCNLTDPILLWNTFKHESLDGAQESIGECLSDKIFISQEPLEATEVCCTAHLIGYHNLHHSLVHRTRASLLGVLQRSFIGKLVVLPSPMKAEIQALLTGDYSPLRKWPDHLRSY